jgi:hypothetical protein
MSNFGLLSTMAYAAVVTWAFWRMWSLGGWSTDFPPLLCFVLITIAARTFATMIHRLAMRGQA